MHEKQLLIYKTQTGKIPYEEWFANLGDFVIKSRISVQINRLMLGLVGDAKSVGGGVHELRIHIGKGYRVYFANDGNLIVLLLCGGSKETQDNDIIKAKEYWHDYRSRTKG